MSADIVTSDRFATVDPNRKEQIEYPDPVIERLYISVDENHPLYEKLTLLCDAALIVEQAVIDYINADIARPSELGDYLQSNKLIDGVSEFVKTHYPKWLYHILIALQHIHQRDGNQVVTLTVNGHGITGSVDSFQIASPLIQHQINRTDPAYDIFGEPDEDLSEDATIARWKSYINSDSLMVSVIRSPEQDVLLVLANILSSGDPSNEN